MTMTVMAEPDKATSIRADATALAAKAGRMMRVDNLGRPNRHWDKAHADLNALLDSLTYLENN